MNSGTGAIASGSASYAWSTTNSKTISKFHPEIPSRWNRGLPVPAPDKSPSSICVQLDPLYTRDHHYGFPIKEIKHHAASENIISYDKKALRIWNRSSGNLLTTVEMSGVSNSTTWIWVQGSTDPGTVSFFAPSKTAKCKVSSFRHSARHPGGPLSSKIWQKKWKKAPGSVERHQLPPGPSTTITNSSPKPNCPVSIWITWSGRASFGLTCTDTLSICACTRRQSRSLIPLLTRNIWRAAQAKLEAERAGRIKANSSALNTQQQQQKKKGLSLLTVSRPKLTRPCRATPTTIRAPC